MGILAAASSYNNKQWAPCVTKRKRVLHSRSTDDHRAYYFMSAGYYKNTRTSLRFLSSVALLGSQASSIEGFRLEEIHRFVDGGRGLVIRVMVVRASFRALRRL